MDWSDHYMRQFGVMAQTQEGARKTAAKMAGVSIEEYYRLVDSGYKWCTKCKGWHPVAEFGNDRSRSDGLSSTCVKGRRQLYRETYIPVPEHLRKTPGPPIKPSEDGNKKQARRKVNRLVAKGKMAKPQALPCFDCGHLGPQTTPQNRHEYDHFKGYAAENHLVVQVVCSSCHVKREIGRGKWGRQQSNGRKEKTGKLE